MSADAAAVWLNERVGLIDLRFQDVPSVIGAYVVATPAGLAIVDCGPTSTLERLLAGMAALGLDPSNLRHVIVTHIHLDHAGAAGALLRRFPAASLYVHALGAPHVRDPTNLLRSATRIYGDQMDALWGELVPIAPERMRVLHDGDRVDLGDRCLDVLYTPGHASHHVMYADSATGEVFAGDIAGIRIPPGDQVWPPTPPPDIDIEAWHASIARMRALAPSRLYLAHFGMVTNVMPHLAELDQHLDAMTEFVARHAAADLDRDALVARLTDMMQAHIANDGGTPLLPAFALATPYGMAVDGILRYLRKRTA